jgi:glutamyl-Q tRNA(Asp) synthetase
VNVSTATATTAIADSYRGRFAPSPTGLLHLGSLLAAVGSYLQARARRGAWQLRFEDLDTPRVIPGAADQMLHTLESFGFEWDGPVTRQSERLDLYRAALERLRAAGLTFACSCSRQALAHLRPPLAADEDEEPFYPGTCRDGPKRSDMPFACRFRVVDRPVEFTDELQGSYRQNVATQVGDFIVQRRDGVYAYQLAVVVDDAAQGITEVVRGCDLLSNTPRQMLLQEALGLVQPRYVHLPLLVEADGSKLAKSRRSVPLARSAAAAQLHAVLRWLGQHPPADLAQGQPRELLTWATAHWGLEPLRGQRTVSLEAV